MLITLQKSINKLVFSDFDEEYNSNWIILIIKNKSFGNSETEFRIGCIQAIKITPISMTVHVMWNSSLSSFAPVTINTTVWYYFLNFYPHFRLHGNDFRHY